MAKSRARFLAELLGSDGLVKATTSSLAGADGIIDLEVLPSIPNSKLTNSSITINSSATSLGGSVTLTTANVAENTNLYYTDARADARITAANTGDLSEGTNLYYTDARADARVNLQTGSNLDLSSKNTGDLSEGSNLYYTNARADARIAAASTDDLSEGSSNLYYTDARADARVALIVDSAPGTLNTLNELAAALGDDANFSTTVTNSIATKLPLAGGALTGNLTTNSRVAIGQSSVTGGNVLLDLHGSGNGVGAQSAYYNDHNTSGFFVGLAGNTTGNPILYNVPDTNIEFYTNNAIAVTIASDGTTFAGTISSGAITSTGNLTLTADAYITNNTSDGSDNGSINISGGGAFGDTRGASLGLAGNENGNGGMVQIRAGQGSYSQIRMYSGGTERVRMDNGGLNILSGTLEVGSTTVIDASRGLTNITGLDMTASTSADIDLNRNGFITFYGNSNNNHGIGSRNASGSAEDDIRINSYGAVYVNLDSNSNNSSGADFVIGRHGGGTGTISTLVTVSGEDGDITTTGNVTAFSDERLKENIQTLDGKKVLEMRGVSFTKDGKDGSGVIAQELEKIAPELVRDGEEYKSVAYGNLVGYLIENAKEQQKEIDELKSLVKQLLEK